MGVIGVAAVALYQIPVAPSALPASSEIIELICLAGLIPLLAISGFGVWLGEVFRMERAGKFIRARETSFNRDPYLPVSSSDAPRRLPIMWESLLYDDKSSAKYGKDRVGSVAACLLFTSVFFGSLGGAALALSSYVQSHPSFPTGLLILVVIWICTMGVGFVAWFYPLLRALAAESHGRLPEPTRLSLENGADVDLILPCLNEIGAIEWIESRIPAGVTTILVDSGSTDGSQAIAETLGLRVVQVKLGTAVGEATRQGIESGTSSIVCVMDCDGTVDPEGLLALIEPIIRGDSDMVLARREFEVGSIGFAHRFAVWARTTALRRRYKGWMIEDIGSARAFRRDALPSGFLLDLDRRNGWSLDFTIATVETLGVHRVTEVVLPYKARIGVSKITGTFVGMILTITDSLRVLRKYPRRAVTRAVEAPQVQSDS